MATSGVVSKKANAGTFAIYIILFLILLAANGLANFVVASFAWSTLATATYWLKTVTGALSGLFAFIIFALMRRDNRIIHDETYNKDLDELNTSVSTSVGPDFVGFCANETRQMKKDAWINKMQNKLTKWTKHLSRKRLTHIGIIERGVWEEAKFFWFKKSKYRKAMRKIHKRERIEERLTPEWIEKHIDYIKIKHGSVTPGEIINGERGTVTTQIINNNAIGDILKTRMPLIAMNVAIQAVFNALLIVGAVSTIAMWLAIIVQLVTIFTNVAFGLNYGKTLFAKLDKNNLLNRKNFLMKYLINKKEV